MEVPMPVADPADPPLFSTPEQLTRARQIAALAQACNVITSDEREYFASTFDAAQPLRLVCSLVSDLWRLAPRGSILHSVAGDFLITTPPTRGGVFEDLDRDADVADVALARRLVAIRENGGAS
jgi:hypothetical protein